VPVGARPASELRAVRIWVSRSGFTGFTGFIW
jgi:hypothetical protein